MTNAKIKRNNQDIKAATPREISKKGWIAILKRVKNQIEEDNVTLVSAGVAFYFFLALFPAIAAIFSIYGLVVEPAQVEEQMVQIAQFLPEKALDLVSGILERTATKSEEALGWSLILSVLFSLWSANKATNAVFVGVGIAYHEPNKRGFLKTKALTLLFTFGGIVAGIVSIAFVIGFPAVIERLNLPEIIQFAFGVLRWIILAVVIYFALAVIYKIAPDRKNPKYIWVNWGAVIATFLWLTGSLLFTLYVNNFGNFDQMYGSIAAIIILLLWFFLTGFIVIMGAEINSEMEHQTGIDSTVGKDKPMGKRGAHYADQVADENKV